MSLAQIMDSGVCPQDLMLSVDCHTRHRKPQSTEEAWVNSGFCFRQLSKTRNNCSFLACFNEPQSGNIKVVAFQI